VTCIW